MQNFKLSFTDSTTYAGKDLEGFYSTALLTGVTKESFKLIPNVKSTAKIAQLNLGDVVQDADCAFSGAGEGTLAQKTVEAHPFKINLEYCQRTFETNYLSELMRPGSNGEAVPATIEEWLKNEIAKKISDTLEKGAWKGSTAMPSFTTETGLEAKLLADTDVVDVVAGTLSKSNIISEIEKVYDAILPEVRQAEDLVIYMPYSAAAFYRQALAAASSETYYMQKHDELEFLGVKIIPCGMSDDKMVAGRKSNFLLITDLVSDFEELLFLPQRTVTGAPVLRVVGEGKFGVDYIYGSEIVYYN